jgi:ribA/ribD-fused uncharacterized protein
MRRALPADDEWILPARDALQIPADNRILYYRRDRELYRFLSHFWPSTFTLDGEMWPTVEHYYQALKSDDPDYRAAIRAAKSPGHVKRLAASPDAPRRISQSSWFREAGKQPRAGWHEAKLGIMRRADNAKYLQNPPLADLLLATGTAELAEDSTSEPFWGIGPDGAGTNWAGRVLMEVRDVLAAG